MHILTQLFLLSFGTVWCIATDCTTYCSILTNTPTAITANQNLGNVMVSANFQVKFDVLLNSLAESSIEILNILDIVDSEGGSTVLQISITENRNLRLLYNDVIRSAYSAEVVADYSSTYTTVFAGHRDGVVYLYTSNNLSYVDTAEVYYLQISAPAQYRLYSAINPPASGTIKNIEISRE